jgi:hypothetical protein
MPPLNVITHCEYLIDILPFLHCIVNFNFMTCMS